MSVNNYSFVEYSVCADWVNLPVLRWAGHVARRGKAEVCTGFWWGSLRERDRWGDRGVNGKIMLGWIFKKWDVGVRTGLGWLRVGIGGGRL
jgi:hypothetical protein